MLTDSRKGLEFSYNLANLPESVEGADGASLTYSYLSDGSKWRASANSGPSILYRGSFVYEDDGNSSRISSIAWDEGRISYHYASAIDSLAVVDSLEVELGEIVVVDTMAVDIVEDGICDEWHVRDHLGSVRAIAGIGNYITGIRELNSYLPFGTRISGSIQAADNRHRFGGKEEQRYGIDADTGSPAIDLGLLDFGARYYDPYTCRWTTRDPMAGNYLSMSPYNYCAGNPVSIIDAKGDSTIVFLARDAAYLFGHIAVAVSSDDGSLIFWSRNGQIGDHEKKVFGKTVGHFNELGSTIPSVQEFLDSEDNTPKGKDDDRIIYSDAYVINTTEQQEKAIVESMSQSVPEDYHFLTNNCAEAVQEALSAGGVSTWYSSPEPLSTKVFPKILYNAVVNTNTGTKYKKTK